jgi:hypothetical protein
LTFVVRRAVVGGRVGVGVCQGKPTVTAVDVVVAVVVTMVAIKRLGGWLSSSDVMSTCCGSVQWRRCRLQR